jgi:hypothetical protein
VEALDAWMTACDVNAEPVRRERDGETRIEKSLESKQRA